MFSQRHLSDHKLKHHLNQTLRRQHELSNRINVLLIEKDKKFKLISRSINHHSPESPEPQHKKTTTLPQPHLLDSLPKKKESQPKSSQVCLSVRKEMNSIVNLKREELKKTRQDWYKEMKKIENVNQKKINSHREQELTLKKKRNRQIKLEEINSKENIKKYWDERVDCIHEGKKKEQKKRYQLFEDSLQNIFILEQKEKELKEEL